MNKQKQQLINFLSELYGITPVEVKKNLKGCTTEEEHNNYSQYYNYNNELVIVLNEFFSCAIVKRIKDINGFYSSLNNDYILYITDYNYLENKVTDYTTCNNIEEFKQLTRFLSTNQVFGSILYSKEHDASVILMHLEEVANLKEISENIDNYYIISAEELLFDSGVYVPEYVRRYVDIQSFIDDLTYDNYIDLGNEQVLYYGD